MPAPRARAACRLLLEAADPASLLTDARVRMDALAVLGRAASEGRGLVVRQALKVRQREEAAESMMTSLIYSY